LLNAFPDRIEHVGDPKAGGESISRVLPIASLNVIGLDVTATSAEQFSNCESKLTTMDAAPRIRRTGIIILRPTILADGAIGKSASLEALCPTAVPRTKTRPRLLT
jgi:hypothetical protein